MANAAFEASTRSSGGSESYADAQEYFAGVKNWRFWSLLAWFDIRGRYRRTLLGPFWSVLNSITFIVILASVYSLLWKVELAKFLPFVAAGYFTWMLFASCIGESCQAFPANGETLKNMPIAPSALLARVVARNLIVFAHNYLVFIGIALIFGVPLTGIFAAIPGVLIVAATSLGIGTVLAFLVARYRDFEQIIQSLLQVVFFISPILWQEKLLPPEARGLADLNPVFHLLRLVRNPLLGEVPEFSAYLVGLVIMGVALAFGLYCYVACRRRLVYWL